MKINDLQVYSSGVIYAIIYTQRKTAQIILAPPSITVAQFVILMPFHSTRYPRYPPLSANAAKIEVADYLCLCFGVGMVERMAGNYSETTELFIEEERIIHASFLNVGNMIAVE